MLYWKSHKGAKFFILRLILFGTFLFFIHSGIFIQASSSASSETSALDILSAVDKKFESFETIKLKVFRELKRPLQQQKDHWLYFYKRPDNYRIEYYSKPTRILTANEKEVIEYIPEAKKAMKTDLKGMSEGQKAQLHKQILTKITLPGLRLGINQTTKGNAIYKIEGHESINGQDVVVIIGTSEDQGRKMVARFWIDTQQNLLLKMESKRDGKFVASTEVKKTQLIDKKYWFPQVVEIKHNSPSGMELARYRFNQVALNQEISASKFTVDLAPDVEVIKPERR